MKIRKIFQLLVFFILVNVFICSANNNKYTRADTSRTIHTDRWLEIDLYWFNKDSINSSVREFWQRNAPFFENIDGWRGIILNVGWLMDYVLDWRGNLEDRIPFPKRMNQEKWFLVEGVLNGTLSEKREQYKQRFANPAINLKKYYQDWTYKDLKILAEQLRTVATKEYGLKDIKVGSFVLAWKSIYGGSPSNWSQKHPGVYRTVDNFTVMDNFDPTSKLSDDTTRYGAFPDGVKKGMPSYEFFAAQWGHLSKTVGLDALVLRDGVIGPGVYTRKGPFGSSASPDPKKNLEWSEASASMVKSVKLANPKALIIGYSSAFSAVADWRVNCFDLENIANQGYLDAYIDQTWAGAWNEAGIREWEYWNRPVAGWTYQMGYMLLHAAVLANSKVHHYHLTETFDAWESWDVIHTVPGRLKWGIWAYSHAAVKMPAGLKMPAGAYISWCNQGMRLLTEKDVTMLVNTLNDAYRDAGQVTDVVGPTIVYCRDAMEWQQKNAPDITIKEWIDEYAGTLMKWSLPVFSVTRSEYLPYIKTDLAIIQTPVHLKRAETDYIKKMITTGQPVAIIGSPAGGIDQEIANLAGIETKDKKPGKVVKYASLTEKSNSVSGIRAPRTFSINQLFTTNFLKGGAKPVYQAMNDAPALNKTELKLVVTDSNGINEFDYADWAEAKLIPSNKREPDILASKLQPVASMQNWAEPQFDKSVAFSPLKISGKAYTSGIGVHANSQLEYAFPPGKYERFESWIGPDDESGGKGAVKFQVFANDSLLYESPVIRNTEAAQFISVALPASIKTGGKILSSPVLLINNSGGKKLLLWDPPEISSSSDLPLINLIGGSTTPYVLVDSLLTEMLRNSRSPIAGNIHSTQPISMGAWQLTDGSYRILTGNLEEGLQFDRDKNVQLEINLPIKWNLNNKCRVHNNWKNETLPCVNKKFGVELKHAECALISVNEK